MKYLLEMEETPLNNVTVLVLVAVVGLLVLLAWGAWNAIIHSRSRAEDDDSVRVLRYNDRLLVWDTIPVVVDKSTVDLYS
mgnify:CR=1 FL=1